MSLNVIGLVSGGKDSLYSLAHCIQNGHKLLAIANLYPSVPKELDNQSHSQEGPDIDSFMYQTVGHSIVPYYEEALGVPLYRKQITGTAVQDGRYYNTDVQTGQGDETEDMYALIKEVMNYHPEANALSSGAILSTYQRTRVESVAARLGLVPLAYLWQYPALPPPSYRKDSLTGLLDDMDQSGCDARIIKIASGGIQANLSFSNVANISTRTKLVSGLTPFFAEGEQEFWLRGAVLGEGGEYETLALDGPTTLWQKRLRIESYETFETVGGALYVRFGRVSLAPQESRQAVAVPLPVLLDERFAAIQSKFVDGTLTAAPSTKPSILLDTNITNTDLPDVKADFNESSSTIQIFNLTAPGATAAEQLDAIIATLPVILDTIAGTTQTPRSCLTARNVVNVSLILGSMNDFAAVNQVYTTKLWPRGLSNPPARVTIAAHLPGVAKVSMTLTYNPRVDGQVLQKGLHVQGRSYWAPANIGPYSQAICVPLFESDSTSHGRDHPPEVVHLAGQIPLVPSTMNMLDKPFVCQATLALQNLWRVAQERSVDTWAGVGVAYIAEDGPNTLFEHDILGRVKAAARIWKLANQFDERGRDTYRNPDTGTNQFNCEEEDEDEDEDEDVDLWDLQQRSRGIAFGRPQPRMTIGKHLHKLPNRSLRDACSSSRTKATMPVLQRPFFIAAEVVGLPRNAPIEWWSIGVAGLLPASSTHNHSITSMPIIKKQSWTLSGISLAASEHDGQLPSIEGEHDQRADRESLCFFITLLISRNITPETIPSLPLSLRDLAPYLKENSVNGDLLHCQLGMAHSFLNVRCPDTQSVHERSQLLQNSSIVLCDRVWASTTDQTGSNTDREYISTVETMDETGRCLSDRLEEEDINEIAAAIIMRIDASTT